MDSSDQEGWEESFVAFSLPHVAPAKTKWNSCKSNYIVLGFCDFEPRFGAQQQTPVTIKASQASKHSWIHFWKPTLCSEHNLWLSEWWTPVGSYLYNSFCFWWLQLFHGFNRPGLSTSQEKDRVVRIPSPLMDMKDGALQALRLTTLMTSLQAVVLNEIRSLEQTHKSSPRSISKHNQKISAHNNNVSKHISTSKTYQHLSKHIKVCQKYKIRSKHIKRYPHISNHIKHIKPYQNISNHMN